MEFLTEIFHYKFLSNAALASLLCGLSCGVIGAYVVCRRLVFLTGGITHASFGGVGIAYYFGANPILGAGLFAVASALGIELLSEKQRVREDSAIGLIWSLGMAIGIIFIYITPGYAPNLMSFLFGNILSVTSADIGWMALLDGVILTVFLFLYRPILYTAFDREFACTQGVKTRVISMLMAALTAVTIVLSIRVVGIVLLISLMTIPALIAGHFTKTLWRIALYGSAVAALCTFLGLWMSYRSNIPSGASTIFVLTLALIAAKLLTLLTSRRRRARA